MTKNLRAVLRATIFSIGGLMTLLAATTAFAGTTLQVVRGSGEFQTLETSITVTKPEALTMQWTTDQAGATAGTWQVTNVTAGNKVVASGETPAPTAGHFLRFSIPVNAFLLAASPASPVKFKISIVAHNAAQQPLGAQSPAVVVSQVPDTPQKPVVFGPNAVFPTVEIVSYDEKIGVVPNTQLHYAVADVTVRVSNKGTAPTDTMWLSVKDNNLLMRQSSPQVSLPSFKAGASQVFTVKLEAILPPPTSQLPEEEQYAKWSQQYRERCGVDLRTVMDYRGPQADAPMNDHAESLPPWEGYGKPAVGPTTPICAGAQCVRVCQIAKNIHAELDGNAVGYSFFVGQYPKFDGYGKARTSAEGTARDFNSKTKITVASVSKMVTAIAAIRILDKNKVSLDDKIGPYLPSDWSVSDYVKNITFSQLLSQSSGIKDYGNVSQDYETVKKFFSQSVSTSTTTSCDPKNSDGSFMTVALGQGFNPNNMNRCYSNFNFAIFRILLPKVAGLKEESDLAKRPQVLADQYVKLVQQNEFDLVGQKDVSCKPPSQLPAASAYSFAYLYPGTKKGFDWGDNTLGCGAAGWYLSVEDITKVLLSISSKDGKIFSATPTKDQFDIMRQRGLGLDVTGDTEMEKNGGWGANCDSKGQNCSVVSTSAAIFGPVTGPRVVGVLFLNSNISGGPSSGGGAQGVLEKAYKNAITTKP